MTFLNIFFSPGAAFRRIKEKPNWIVPLIVVLIFTMGVAIVATSKMDRSKIRDRIEEQMKERGVSEDQIQQQMDQFEKMSSNPVMKYLFPLISVIVITVILLLLSALVLNWVVPAACGAHGTFALTFAVISWGAIVRVAGAIVRGILIFARGTEHLSTGLLLAFPNLKPGFAYAFLNGIDIFAIWETILVAMGLKIVYDLKGRSAYLYVFLLWILSVAVIALLALMPGAGGMS